MTDATTQDGVHGMVPRERMDPGARKWRDAYALTPGAPFFRYEFGYYCLDAWKAQGMPQDVPYAELFDAATGAMKPLDELRKAFTGAGVDMTKPIVTTCGSGVSALVLTLALYRLGVRGTALYDGSWAEWGLPDGPPLATGPA